MFHESRAAVLDVTDVCAWPTHFERHKVVTQTRDPLILLVDDDQDLQEFVATFLRNENYRVSRARDGFEALEKARQLSPSGDCHGSVFAAERTARHFPPEILS